MTLPLLCPGRDLRGPCAGILRVPRVHRHTISRLHVFVLSKFIFISPTNFITTHQAWVFGLRLLESLHRSCMSMGPFRRGILAACSPGKPRQAFDSRHGITPPSIAGSSSILGCPSTIHRYQALWLQQGTSRKRRFHASARHYHSSIPRLRCTHLARAIDYVRSYSLSSTNSTQATGPPSRSFHVSAQAGAETLLGSWSEEEDRILAEGVINGRTFAAIATSLSGRSRAACASRARRQGFTEQRLEKLHESSMKRWSKRESRILTEGIAKGLTYREICKRLPGRSVKACSERVNRQKLVDQRPERYHAWSHSPKPWSEQETRTLAQGLMNSIPITDVLKKLPGRSLVACLQFAYYRDLLQRASESPDDYHARIDRFLKAEMQPISTTRGRWTREEKRYLVDARAKTLSAKAIASSMDTGRTILAVLMRLAQLKANPSRQRSKVQKRWTEEEDQYVLRSWANRVPYEEMARSMGRQPTADALRRRVWLLKKRHPGVKQEPGEITQKKNQ